MYNMNLFLQNITEEMMIEDIKGHSIPAIQVFSNMIGLLKKRAEKEIKNYCSIPVDHNTQWVLTIPAVWTDKAETFMRTCAERVRLFLQNFNIIRRTRNNKYRVGKSLSSQER